MEQNDMDIAAPPLTPHPRIWGFVSKSPLRSLWDFQGASPWLVLRRTVQAFNEDDLLARAAELGYYFLFALFPALVCASAILGLVARSATDIYLKLLQYMTLVVPRSGYGILLDTFNQTATHASNGKLTFGLVAAIWSASVGFAAIQDTLNIVYKVTETRPYWKARGIAMLVTLLLGIILSLTLASLFVATVMARLAHDHIAHHWLAWAAAAAAHTFGAIVALAFLVVLFAVIYYFAPNVEHRRWRWCSPGAAIGIAGWLVASVALRAYLHFFNNYSITYGSLGAVIILLTWFYVTGLMLLLGAEINSEIEASVIEARLQACHTKRDT